jgi:TPR repeat protein
MLRPLIITLFFLTQSFLSLPGQTPEATFLAELKDANATAVATIEEIEPKAIAGDPNAMLNVARAYWQLVVLASGDQEQAIMETSWRWYEKAARQTDDPAIAAEAASELVENYWYQENIKGLQYWANEGHADAQFRLADRLRRDPEGRAEAIQWYRKSAEQGHLKSVAWMASATELGTFTEIDLPASLQWWTKGSELGDPEMTYQLARRYHLGYGSRWPEFTKDIRKANALYLQAGNAGHVEALVYLARLFVYAKSDKNADVVTGELIRMKRPEGHFYRGELFEKGIGRDIDLEQAKYYYEKAFEMGYAEAEFALRRLENHSD